MDAKTFHQYAAGGGGTIAGAGPGGADVPPSQMVESFNNKSNPLAIQPIAVQGGHHVLAPDASQVHIPDDLSTTETSSHAFNAPTRIRTVSVAEDGSGMRTTFTVNSRRWIGVSCHCCGNLQKNNVLCVRCPNIFCLRCAGKMTAEHGRNVFDGGAFCF